MIDLRNCKPGDKLRSVHGMVLTYEEHRPNAAFPHVIRYPDGAVGTRTDEGYVFRNKRLPEDHDIAEIVGA